LVAVGFLSRVYEREEQLADILDLPWARRDVDLSTVVEQHSSLVESTIGVAGNIVDSFDAKGSMLKLLERARLPVRPGEFVLFVVAGGVVLGAVVAAGNVEHRLRCSRLRLQPSGGQGVPQPARHEAEEEVRGAVPRRAHADRLVPVGRPHVSCDPYR